MRALELLAPARNLETGLAAVDCGADAVYIAGPGFGARADAGNPVADIAALCAYAHRFGVRIFATVNTIVYDDELPAVRDLLRQLKEAGVDAVIAQDLAVMEMARAEGLIVHASTQCAIRTRERARFLESLGCGRLVLERELSLAEVSAIAGAVEAEIEFFVHGAVCVCYNGQCFLSEHLAGRSANRGACIQACRSLYDLEDARGQVLMRNKAFLSMKDYRLIERLGDLTACGVTSFKIEGRLKNVSYVRNVTRAYSDALDALVAASGGKYRRASYGTVRGGFTPDLDKTFNRGYSPFYLDGERGRWASLETPKWAGEPVGTVVSVAPGSLCLGQMPAGVVLHNGDGFAFVDSLGQLSGFRGDVCEGTVIRSRNLPALRVGDALYRNIDPAFEKQLARQPERTVAVAVSLSGGALQFRSEDGRTLSLPLPSGEPARDPERARELLRTQLEKKSGIYRFSLADLPEGAEIPHLGASQVNALRREAALRLDGMPVSTLPMYEGQTFSYPSEEILDYKADIANSRAAALYRGRGAVTVAPSYEQTHPAGAELMRTRYCLRHELGLCPRQKAGEKPEPLYLKNGGNRLRLEFDCRHCEMVVK